METKEIYKYIQQLGGQIGNVNMEIHVLLSMVRDLAEILDGELPPEEADEAMREIIRESGEQAGATEEEIKMRQEAAVNQLHTAREIRAKMANPDTSNPTSDESETQH